MLKITFKWYKINRKWDTLGEKVEVYNHKAKSTQGFQEERGMITEDP